MAKEKNNEPVTKYWNQRALVYDRSQDASQESQIYENLALENIRSFLPKSQRGVRVLDAGGGTGRLAAAIAKWGYQVTLTDISPKMVEFAKKRAERFGVKQRMRFMILDLEDMSPLEDNSFDVTVSEFYPVSYCKNPARAVKELVRVTRAGGYVIVSVCNKAQLIQQWIRNKEFNRLTRYLEGKPAWFDGSYSCKFYDVRSIEKLMEKAGLKLVKLFSKNKFTQFLTEEELSKPAVRRKILNLEKQFSEDPFFHAFGMDLVGVGRKR